MAISRAALTLLLLAAPAMASAQDSYDSDYGSSSSSGSSGRARGLGVGLLTTLTGPFGPAGAIGVLYDGGTLHIDGLLGLSYVEDNRTTFGLAGRVLWVVHQADRADFAVGPGLAVSHVDFDRFGDNDDTTIHLEGVGRVRVFLTDNVALLASLGLGLVLADSTTLALGSQLSGAFGIGYFFN